MATIECSWKIFAEMVAEARGLRAQLSSAQNALRDERVTSANLRSELFRMNDVREELDAVRQEQENLLKAKVKRVRDDALNIRAGMLAAHDEEVASLKNKLSDKEREIEVR